MYREADGPWDMRKAVREQIKRGAEFSSSWPQALDQSWLEDPEPPQMTLEEMKAIVDEAHRMGKRVAAHAEGLEGTRWALEAGADTIEHGLALHRELRLLDEMAERGTVLVPTLSTFHDLAERFANNFPVVLVEQAKRQLEGGDAHGRNGPAGRRHARARLRQRCRLGRPQNCCGSSTPDCVSSRVCALPRSAARPRSDATIWGDRRRLPRGRGGRRREARGRPGRSHPTRGDPPGGGSRKVFSLAGVRRWAEPRFLRTTSRAEITPSRMKVTSMFTPDAPDDPAVLDVDVLFLDPRRPDVAQGLVGTFDAFVDRRLEALTRARADLGDPWTVMSYLLPWDDGT